MSDFFTRLGHCYELAAQYVLDNKPSTSVNHILVHGTISGGGFPPNPHAWVIVQTGMGHRIYDPVLDRHFSPSEWLLFASPEAEQHYTYREVVFMLMEHQHYGPWPDPETNPETEEK